MSDYIFLFDMDSTITRKEVLPEVSKRIGKLDEMRRLTEATMRGEIPFRTSFLNRVKILSDISVSEVNQVVSEIPLILLRIIEIVVMLLPEIWMFGSAA